MTQEREVAATVEYYHNPEEKKSGATEISAKSRVTDENGEIYYKVTNYVDIGNPSAPADAEVKRLLKMYGAEVMFEAFQKASTLRIQDLQRKSAAVNSKESIAEIPTNWHTMSLSTGGSIVNKIKAGKVSEKELAETITIGLQQRGFSQLEIEAILKRGVKK